jgi:uncharacterized protein (TIGR00730 family)
MKRIAVYCASSSKIHQRYFLATEKLAILLVQNNYEVIYGGGSVGLMGILADTVLKNGGRITGIIPHFMNDLEWGHTGLTNLVVVNTMHERKQAMLENTDGLIALPGGTGTLEELLEAITLKRLGLYTKPIIILNTNGYYGPLQEMFNKSISENFMNVRHNEMWRFVKTPAKVIDILNTMPGWDKNAIEFAVVR